MTSLAESLTAQFYAWERRGRGWQVHPYRVAVEPAFTPFVLVAPTPAFHDDGRRPPIWESLWKLATKRRAPPRAPEPDEPVEEAEEADTQIAELQVRLPSGTDISGALADELLLAVATVSRRTAFELIAANGGLTLQFAVAARHAAGIQRVLEGYVPGAVVTTMPTLRTAWDAAGAEGVLVDFGLRNEFMLPLPVRRSLSIDPLLAVIAALEGVQRGECAVVQVLFQPARVEWAASALRAMSDGEGHAFFADAPETLGLTREKLARPLLAAVIRVGARAASEERTWEIAQNVGRAVMGVYGGGANDLIPLEAEGYNPPDHEADLLDRATHRSGMLVSSAELAALVHLPTAGVETEDLRASASRTKAAPAVLQAGEVVLGENVHRGRSVAVHLRASDRLRHTHLIGATGTGKSTLLKSLIRQDLEAGRGLALLDPHGDLADEVLGLVPDDRLADVVLFDPADEEFPIGFNALDAHSDRERELLASDLVGVFRRFSTSWGDQMSAVLGNAVMAFLESAEGGSLLDLRRFLMDKDARGTVLATVTDPLVTSFWRDEFPRLSGRPQMPIITRLDVFLRPKCIRNIVSQQQSRFDLSRIMDSGGIFIGRLSQGAVGEQNAYLLGSLLVAKFQQAAMARERQAEGERRPFFLYLDEFHHFTTPSIAALLSGARKYRLGLILAHQELRQLAEHDIRSAVLANAGTRICFRVGDEDARTLAAGFKAFDASDLMSLGTGQALCRVSQADQDFNLRCPPPAAADGDVTSRRVNAVRENSRRRYGVGRAEVEAVIAQWGRSPAKEEPDSAPVPLRAPSPRVPATPPVETKPVAAAKMPTQRATAKLRVARPGKGGAEHKYLQSLIKSYAESKGFRAAIEAAVEGGSIDVLLQRDYLRIACEISVTTDPEHEAANVRKCLGSGAARVLVVSPSPAGLKKLEQGMRETLVAEELEKVTFVPPPGVIAFLDECGAGSAPDASAVLGYKVRTSVRAGAPGDGTRAQSVARTIVQAMQRLKRM